MIKATIALQVGAPAQAKDVEAQLSALDGLAPEQLRVAWRRHYRMPPPSGRGFAMRLERHADRLETAKG